MQTNDDHIRDEVRERYSKIALPNKDACNCSPSCCSPADHSANVKSTQLGYSDAQLEDVPDGANLGLGCGNPQAIAMLKPGEIVLDLGCGAGFDSFLAAKQVGGDGSVIGVDMTPEMIRKARDNVRRGPYANVEFRLGEIEHLPVADNSVDIIMSNCVINLSVDKHQVYAEAFRVLRAGGRLAISDVVALQSLPDEIRNDMEKYAGCVAGAAVVKDLERMLAAVGFHDIHVDIREDSKFFIKDWFPGSGVEKYVRSADIRAKK